MTTTTGIRLALDSGSELYAVHEEGAVALDGDRDFPRLG
jgi:hypothetical protein